jgi:putative redox protein
MGANPNVVTVVENGRGPYGQHITVGHHVMSADEPESNGGQDTGPSPYGFLLAGLGACTAMKLRSYAGHRNWALHQITIELRHEKIHAEGNVVKIDVFHRIIHLDGDLSEAQRQELLADADRCSVSETLRHAALVESRLAEVNSPNIAAQAGLTGRT